MDGPSAPPPGSDQPEGEQPSAPPPTSGSSTGTSTNLEPNIAALLCYVLGWVTGLIFYFIEKEHAEVRFHAAQSIIVFGALSVVSAVLYSLVVIPVLGLIFLVIAPLVSLLAFILWIYLMLQGYGLKHVKIPVAGAYAEQLAAKQL